MLQISGLTYSWDNKRPDQGRIVEVRKGGKPIDKAVVYTVTVNSYLADGNDHFTVLKNGTNRVEGPVDLDALVAYVKGMVQPFSAAVEGRITRMN
ncbi:MAG: 5'-nucleotidase C-terminal domain-containing protein [Desulfobaccales bacterium]